MLTIDGIIYSLQSVGGISIYFNELVRHLAFPQSSVLTFSDKIDLPRNSNVRRVVRGARIGERYRHADLSGIKNSCIFHSSYYRLPAQHSYKVVTTVHDFTYEKFIKGPKKWLHSTQKYNAIKGSDAVICISKNTARDLLHFCPIPEHKIRIIPNGVSSSFKVKYPGLYDHDNYVLFVGSRAKYKNFDVAVTSLREKTELKLVIAGGGNLTQKEISLLERNLPGRYVEKGFLSETELIELYRGAYCLLYPSAYEGFGIPILEAMAVGCPVIALNASSIPEVAGDSAILIDKPFPSVVSDALQALKEPGRRSEMVKRGLIQASLFSWRKTACLTMDVYREFL